MNSCEVLVIGGGPAGAIAARTLAQAGLATVLADDAVTPRRRIGESLPGVAVALLRTLGLLSSLAPAGRLDCVGNVSCWGDAESASTDFIRDPNGCGWHLDRTRFDQDLRYAAYAAGTLPRQARVRHVAAAADAWHVELDDGTLHARWLVDASGRAGAMARWLRIPRQQDEPMVALHAWGVDDCADRRSLIEAVPQGWWYTAGLPHGRRVAALHVRPDHAARLLRGDAWRRLLSQTRHVREACHIDDSWSRPVGTDAGGAWMTVPCGPRWLAVGDAALALDPLSSQGILNALYTGWRAAEALLASVRDGTTTALIAYAARVATIRAVYRDNLRAYYEMEQRWPAQSFWRARQRGAAVHIAG